MAITHQELLDLARTDLYTFVSMSWRIAGGKKAFVPSWHVEAICEHLEALYRLDIRNLIISISPRKGKSLICGAIFPVWVWLTDPSHTFINASYGDHLAKRDAKRSRDLIESKWFRERWGVLCQIKDDEKAAGNYSNDKGGQRIATSVDGKGTGEGCHTMIIDDPHKAKEGTSKPKKDNVWNWFQGTMGNRYHDEFDFRRLVIHQRVASDDLTGRLMKEEPEEWEILKLPEEYIPTTYITCIGWSDPRTVKGELLCPELLSKEGVAKYKKDRFFWASQYQQDPVPEEGGYIARSDIYKFSATQLAATCLKRGSIDAVYTSWDLASGENILNDYTVGQLWVVIGHRKYLIEQVRGKWLFPTQVMQFNQLNQKAMAWASKSKRPLTHLIEDASNGRSLQQYLESQSGVRNVLLVKPKISKMDRFMQATFDFAQHYVYINETQPLDDWVEELTKFPYIGHDDQVDATSQMINYENSLALATTQRGATPPVTHNQMVLDARKQFTSSEKYPTVALQPSTIKKMFAN